MQLTCKKKAGLSYFPALGKHACFSAPSTTELHMFWLLERVARMHVASSRHSAFLLIYCKKKSHASLAVYQHHYTLYSLSLPSYWIRAYS